MPLTPLKPCRYSPWERMTLLCIRHSSNPRPKSATARTSNPLANEPTLPSRSQRPVARQLHPRRRPLRRCTTFRLRPVRDLIHPPCPPSPKQTTLVLRITRTKSRYTTRRDARRYHLEQEELGMTRCARWRCSRWRFGSRRKRRRNGSGSRSTNSVRRSERVSDKCSSRTMERPPLPGERTRRALRPVWRRESRPGRLRVQTARSNKRGRRPLRQSMPHRAVVDPRGSSRRSLRPWRDRARIPRRTNRQRLPLPILLLLRDRHGPHCLSWMHRVRVPLLQ